MSGGLCRLCAALSLTAINLPGDTPINVGDVADKHIHVIQFGAHFYTMCGGKIGLILRIRRACERENAYACKIRYGIKS